MGPNPCEVRTHRPSERESASALRRCATRQQAAADQQDESDSDQAAELTSATAAIGVLQSDLSALDGKVDGRAIVYYQATDPKNLPTTWGSDQTGDIWINTSGATTVYNVWTGAAWRVITDPVATQALSTVQTKTTTYYKATKPILSDIQAPETAFRLGNLWIRTSDNHWLVREGISSRWQHQRPVARIAG